MARSLNKAGGRGYRLGQEFGRRRWPILRLTGSPSRRDPFIDCLVAIMRESKTNSSVALRAIGGADALRAHLTSSCSRAPLRQANHEEMRFQTRAYVRNLGERAASASPRRGRAHPSRRRFDRAPESAFDRHREIIMLHRERHRAGRARPSDSRRRPPAGARRRRSARRRQRRRRRRRNRTRISRVPSAPADSTSCSRQFSIDITLARAPIAVAARDKADILGRPAPDAEAVGRRALDGAQEPRDRPIMHGGFRVRLRIAGDDRGHVDRRGDFLVGDRRGEEAMRAVAARAGHVRRNRTWAAVVMTLSASVN